MSDQRATCGGYTYYYVEVTDPCKDLRVKLTQTAGEPNVYVSKSPNKYPHYLSLAWSSYNWGGEDLIISSWDPEFTVGTYFIGVHSFCSEEVHTGDNDARYSLLVESKETDHTDLEISLNGTVDGSLDANGYHYYRFCVPNTCSSVEVRLDNCLDSTKCPTNYAYPELLVSRSIIQPTINDHTWKLADVSQRSVYLKHDDAEFYPGHHFVGVYGWCTPDDECPDMSTCGPCEYANGHPYQVSVLLTEGPKDCTSRKALKALEVCEGGSGGHRTEAKLSVFLLNILFLSTIYLLT